MTARCDQCGHENNPEYRFCGMCGAPLEPVTPPREPERTRVSAVGGPSFLGLGDDRTNDLDYLLDEEPPHGHGRLYLALVLLALSAGLLAWHWQRDGYPWASLARGPVAPASSATASAPNEPSTTSPNTNVASPATEASPTTGTAAGQPASQKGSAGDNPSSPTSASEVKPSPPTSQPGAGSNTVDPPAKPSLATSQNSSNDNAGDKTAQDAAAQNRAAQDQPVQQKDIPEKDAPDASESVPEKPAPTVPARKPALAKPSPTIPAETSEDRLVDEGERYLYGRGVRPDCDLAQRNLMIGARQSNPKAQTLLGAMYATGHCVGRDLPTAYRWFAKALHGDPSNSRVQRDLEVLWKQMTPEERMLAMKNQ
jgi:hypothetical protein